METERLFKEAWAAGGNGCDKAANPSPLKTIIGDYDQRILHQYGKAPEPYSIKIERGMKGQYGFEISVKGSDPIVIIEQIKAIDAQLKREFITEI